MPWLPILFSVSCWTARFLLVPHRLIPFFPPLRGNWNRLQDYVQEIPFGGEHAKVGIFHFGATLCDHRWLRN